MRQRWVEALADPEVAVEVLDDEEHPGLVVAFVAFDEAEVRHLGVHPRYWRRGHARKALGVATSRMVDPRLWVLERNHRARSMYEHLGWAPTGRSRPAEFPPFPVEVELAYRR
ncbi:GNAT family N-acetyltransferase [Phycicoccus sp. CSK15P-2]|nr:GNAT family N-acetyltransferase [Phycicoccus sp. CSK15P-2]MBM6405790.1 GNAT family N-acetyltransferase [Phycicoccus sp. CSK15P-2]